MKISIEARGAAAVCMVIALAATAAAAAGTTRPAPADSTQTIPGGTAGKTLKSITVEGEDRVRVQFDRPELKISLDPTSAHGLDWDSMLLVLDASSFDFTRPLLERSAYERAAYAPRPWFDAFRSGPVASFRPAVSGVEQWTLEVADSRGRTVANFAGKGKVPKAIEWDGRTTDGGAVRPDLTYSYVFNAIDKAGNKRSFVGDSFQIPPHAVDAEGRGGLQMMFSVPAQADAEIPQAYVLEAASRLNGAGGESRAVQVAVTAPSLSIAKAIGDGVANSLRRYLAGDPSRVSTTTQVDAGGGERAAVVIGFSGPQAPRPSTGK